MSRELLKEGKAAFEIRTVWTTTAEGDELLTKGGDPKVVVVVDVVDQDGKAGTLYEHLTEKAEWRIKQIFEACGHLEDLYQSQKGLDALPRLKGCRGDCKIITQEASGKYPEQSRVGKYFAKKAIPKEVDTSFVLDDDDIPF